MEQQKLLYAIVTENLMLVPYLKSMVEKYHEWMTDQEMLYLTCSEPLTLEEEYENQVSWIKDTKKYTFIIFKKYQDVQLDDDNKLVIQVNNGLGDINLYFHDYIEENEAEIEVMIAEKQFRNKGFASEALKAMMLFGKKYYKIDTFIAKILNSNLGSVKLFEKLNFVKFKNVEVFDESHYKYDFQMEGDLQIKELNSIE